MADNLLDEEDKSSVTYLLLEILKKYGLEEDPDKEFEKIEKNEPTNGGIISKICSDLAKNLVSEQDALLAFKKNLGIPDEKATQIINDIKNTVFPPLKINLEKRTKTASNKILEERTDKSEDLLPPKRFLDDKEPTTIKEPVITENISKLPKKIKRETPKKSGPDNYREPIE